MLKTMMIGLDGSRDSHEALELGLRWAKVHKARLVGIGVVDLPGIQLSGATIYAEGFGYSGPVDAGLVDEVQTRVETALDAFAQRCEAEHVGFDTLKGTGTPYLELLTEAQRYDLVLLGRRTHFGYGWAQGSNSTLKRVVRGSARPVVMVPSATPDDASPVVLAFDGSTPSARALGTFVASGLGRGRTLLVVSIDGAHEAAVEIADRAVDFLRSHDLIVEPRPLASAANHADALLAEVERLGAGLLVMGASGHSILRELFGSTTKSVLERAEIPVFCTH